MEKKLLEYQIEVQQQSPEAKVEVWCEDEARLGLKPVLRRKWAVRGKRPLAKYKMGYQWIYVWGFAHPASGESDFFIMPNVNKQTMEIVLDKFSKEKKVGPDKIIIIVLDNAPWHASKNIKIPDGIKLFFLPPYTPELQPAEHLWPTFREALANKLWTNIEDVENAVSARCDFLYENKLHVTSMTKFSWWNYV